jgi:hypothetical protein
VVGGGKHHRSPITDHLPTTLSLPRQTIRFRSLTACRFHLESARGARLHMMAPAAKLLQDAGSLDLALERLEYPLDTIGLTNNDFRQRFLSR